MKPLPLAIAFSLFWIGITWLSYAWPEEVWVGHYDDYGDTYTLVEKSAITLKFETEGVEKDGKKVKMKQKEKDGKSYKYWKGEDEEEIEEK